MTVLDQGDEVLYKEFLEWKKAEKETLFKEFLNWKRTHKKPCKSLDLLRKNENVREVGL